MLVCKFAKDFWTVPRGGIMPAAETASPEDLIRMLVQRSSTSLENGNEIGCDLQNEEIIFDAEVDGARYLLIHLRKPAQVHAQLSPREQEIVRLVALGHSNKIIGDVLNISSWTVCTHLRRIFAKLGVGSRAAMVARLPEIGRKPGLPQGKRKAVTVMSDR
jgi:DNA-binding CsgD family transcriptional regulator